MKVQYFKTFGSTLIVGAFLFLALGSEKGANSEKNENKIETPSEKNKTCWNCGKHTEYGRVTEEGGNYMCYKCINEFNDMGLR